MRRLKHLLIALVVVALIPTVLIIFDSNKLAITRYEIGDSSVPLSFEGFKIVQVSDFHGETIEYPNLNIITAISEENPDVIILTGDFIDEQMKNLQTIREFLSGLTNFTILYENGNHDIRAPLYAEFKSLFSEFGVIDISGSRHTITRGGDQLAVIGVEQAIVDNHWGLKPAVGTIIGPSIIPLIDAEDDFTILASHHPDFYPEARDIGINLMLSGHFHGGHLRLFDWSPIELFDPTFGGGHFNFDQLQLVVSRGAGSGIFPFRINCDAEIVVMTLTHITEDGIMYL